MSEQIPKTIAVVCHGPHDYRLDETLFQKLVRKRFSSRLRHADLRGDKSRLALPCFGETTFSLRNKPPVVAGHEFLVLSLLWAQVLLRSMG